MNPAAPVRVIASASSWIEGEALLQLERTAALPGMRLAVGLPDLHPGKGHPVGAAFAAEGLIYPFLVGSDIGCGMSLFSTDLLERKAKRDRWVSKLRGLDDAWEGDTGAFLEERGLRAGAFDQALGTIGGGNHFAELQSVDEVIDETLFEASGLSSRHLLLLVHSGSRGLGDAILREHTGKHGAESLVDTSEAGEAYLAAHDRAVLWAKANRELIARRFAGAISASLEPRIDICHNSVTRAELASGPAWLHRKGAAPADQGLVVIPGSRGDLSYLVMPTLSCQDSAFSVAHGAGRKWTRTDARSRGRARYRAAELVRTELGGEVICEDRDLLFEEAPEAYKSIARVIADLLDAQLVKVVATLRPLITYKTRSSGHEE